MFLGKFHLEEKKADLIVNFEKDGEETNVLFENKTNTSTSCYQLIEWYKTVAAQQRLHQYTTLIAN